MAETGTYLSSFVENFLRARGLEEQRSRNEARDLAEVFNLKQYLDQLDREHGAQNTLATVLRNRQQPSPAGMAAPALPTGQAPVGVPFGPTEGVNPNPMAPEAQQGAMPGLPPQAPPMPAAPSLAAGGAAAVARPPVLDTVLGGISPEEQAKFLTSKTGQHVLPTLTQAEAERRKEEDKAEAGKFFDKATEAFRAMQPAEAADYLASGFRRIGAVDQAARMMEYGAKVRHDKDEEAKAKEDFKAINAAIEAHDSDPSPSNLAKIHHAFEDAKSAVGRGFAMEMMKAGLASTLSPDREINRLLKQVTDSVLKGMPTKQAWEDAIQKFPGGFSKLWQQDIMNPDKTQLPPEVWEILRMTPPAMKKDQTLAQRAHVLAVGEAKKLGIPVGNTPEFTRIWQTQINSLIEQEARAKETPTERKKKDVELGMAEDRAAMLKQRRYDMEHPEETLAKKTLSELTLAIQRSAADLRDGELSPQDAEDTKAYLAVLRQYRNAKAGVKSGAGETPAPGTFNTLPPASQYRGRTMRDTTTGKRFTSDGAKWVEVK